MTKSTEMRRASNAPQCDCGSRDLRVVNTRPREGYRQRQFTCDKCGAHYHSAEVLLPSVDATMTRKQVIALLLKEVSTAEILLEIERRCTVQESIPHD